MNEEHFKDLAAILLEKTREGKLRWDTRTGTDTHFLKMDGIATISLMNEYKHGFFAHHYGIQVDAYKYVSQIWRSPELKTLYLEAGLSQQPISLPSRIMSHLRSL